MPQPRYIFQSRWDLDAPLDDVFVVLGDVGAYPQWWSEVRDVRTKDHHTGELRCRSLLPYNLRFTTTPSKIDPESGVLEATLVGDLNGFSRWSLTAHATGTIAQFDEDVTTNKTLLNVLAPIGRAAFVLNHRLMMNHGETGLRKYLADHRLTS